MSPSTSKAIHKATTIYALVGYATNYTARQSRLSTRVEIETRKGVPLGAITVGPKGELTYSGSIPAAVRRTAEAA